MGVYVYSLRKKAIDVELDDGSVVKAVALAYAYKPHTSFFHGSAAYNRMTARFEAAAERAKEYWDNQENPPTHMVYYSPDDGSYESLYEVSRLPSVIYDSAMDKYDKIGEVEKTKRGRKVVYKQINMKKVNLLRHIDHIEGVRDGRIVVFS